MESLKIFLSFLIGVIAVGLILSLPICAALSLITIQLGVWVGFVETYLISLGAGIIFAIARNIPSIKTYQKQIDKNKIYGCRKH